MVKHCGSSLAHLEGVKWTVARFREQHIRESSGEHCSRSKVNIQREEVQSITLNAVECGELGNMAVELLARRPIRAHDPWVVSTGMPISNE